MEKRTTTLEACVRDQLERYFRDLDGESTGCIWQMVISAVERPMLEAVLARAGGNQSRAAEMLGINRNTLRKKIDQYGLRTDTVPPAPATRVA